MNWHAVAVAGAVALVVVDGALWLYNTGSVWKACVAMAAAYVVPKVYLWATQ